MLVAARIPIMLLLATVLPAADGFLGRWNITPQLQGRPRGWWLEVADAGGGRLRGSFSSVYDGKVNPAEEVSVVDGELRLVFAQKLADGRTRRFEHRARLVDGTLQGSQQPSTPQGKPVRWTGVPAPKIDDHDDGSWRKGTPRQLFNGRDLAGWHGVLPTGATGWSVKDGLLATTGKGCDLATGPMFWNFEMRIEFRLAAKSNSGLGLRGRYEVQMKDDAGDPPLSNGTGAIYSRIVPKVNAGKPAGQWQKLHVRLVGREVTVVLNGKRVIHKQVIDGPNAIAIDSDEAKPGAFVLQGDHGPAEFRNIVVTPLERKGRK